MCPLYLILGGYYMMIRNQIQSMHGINLKTFYYKKTPKNLLFDLKKVAVAFSKGENTQGINFGHRCEKWALMLELRNRYVVIWISRSEFPALMLISSNNAWK